MWSKKEKKKTEKWFIRKRKNTRDGCPFVLPSPLAFWASFSVASPTFLLRVLLQCTPQDAVKLERRLAQPKVFPHGRCLCTIYHPTLASLLSTLSYDTLTLCSTSALILLSLWLENTQASSFPKSPLILTNSRKGFLLNCSRRFSKN